MKSLSLTLPALLLAALTACSPLSAPEATPTPTATPAATAEPTPTPTAVPTPTPDPSAGLEYEMLTLPTTPQPPHLYDGEFLTRDETQTERSNGYALIEALYTNDADKLRGGSVRFAAGQRPAAARFDGLGHHGHLFGGRYLRCTHGGADHRRSRSHRTACGQS